MNDPAVTNAYQPVRSRVRSRVVNIRESGERPVYVNPENVTHAHTYHDPAIKPEHAYSVLLKFVTGEKFRVVSRIDQEGADDTVHRIATRLNGGTPPALSAPYPPEDE